MTTLIGSLRLVAFALLLLGGTLLVLLLARLPLRYRDARLAAWVTSLMARLALRIMGIRLAVADAGALRRHRGFIFPNHTSLVDVIALEALFPMRYLAKHEVRRYPVFGALARANETVFVERESKASRAAARVALGQIGDYPPIVLFPEGTTNPGDRLLPFRHGAFATAREAGLSVRLCAIIYDRPDLMTWAEEPLVASFWRIVKRRRPLHVTLQPLPVGTPEPSLPAGEAAAQARRALAAVLVPHGMAQADAGTVMFTGEAPH